MVTLIKLRLCLLLLILSVTFTFNFKFLCTKLGIDSIKGLWGGCYTGGVAVTILDQNSVNATSVLHRGCCMHNFESKYCKCNTVKTTPVVSRVLQISVAVPKRPT